MPTYQYACRSCGHRFDIVQGFSDDALRTCPNCQLDELRKLFGNVGVVFKGSGFYRNDSRSGAKSAPAAAGAKSDSGSDGGSKPSAPEAGSGGGSTPGGSGETGTKTTSSKTTSSTAASKAPAGA